MMYQTHNSSGSFRFERTYYKDYQYEPHFHSDFELVCMIEGEMEVSLETRRYTLKGDEVLLVFSNQIHGFHTLGHSRCCILVFSHDLTHTFALATADKMCENPILGATENGLGFAIRPLLQEDDMSLFRIQSLLYAVCGHFAAKEYVPRHHLEDQSLLRKMLTYCSEHFQENITLAEFSRQYGYNTKYCSNCFHSVVSINFREFINQMRVRLGKQMLLETDRTITEIAFSCGFQNIRSFNRAFLHETGMPPREYRMRKGQDSMHIYDGTDENMEREIKTFCPQNCI